MGGLASENVRWAEAVEEFKKQETKLPGDVLLVTAFVSYFGYFTKVSCLSNRQKLPSITYLRVVAADARSYLKKFLNSLMRVPRRDFYSNRKI